MDQRDISFLNDKLRILGEVTTLAGWTGLITVLTQLYQEADPTTKDEISVLASDGGMCLSSARRAIARGAGKGEDLEAQYPYLNEVTFRKFEERELSNMKGVSTMKELRKQYGYSDNPTLKDLDRANIYV